MPPKKRKPSERAILKAVEETAIALKRLERWQYASAMTLSPGVLQAALDAAFDKLHARFSPAQRESVAYREQEAIFNGLFYAALDRGLIEPIETE